MPTLGSIGGTLNGRRSLDTSTIFDGTDNMSTTQAPNYINAVLRGRSKETFSRGSQQMSLKSNHRRNMTAATESCVTGHIPEFENNFEEPADSASKNHMWQKGLAQLFVDETYQGPSLGELKKIAQNRSRMNARFSVSQPGLKTRNN